MPNSTPLPDAFFANPTEAAKKPVGAGPYQIEEYTPNQKVVLRKFADCGGAAPKGNVDQITFRIYKDFPNLLSAQLKMAVEFAQSQPLDAFREQAYRGSLIGSSVTRYIARSNTGDDDEGDRTHLRVRGQVHGDVFTAVDLDVHRVAVHRGNRTPHADTRGICGLGNAHGHQRGQAGGQEHLVECRLHGSRFPVYAVVTECIIDLQPES